MIRAWVVRLSLVVVATLLAAGAAEVVLRAADYSYAPLLIEAEAYRRNDAREEHILQREVFETDPRLLWKPLSGRSVFNDRGYRGAELGPKREGEFRILAVGDSNTLGWGGAKGANWPEELERLMPSGGTHSVINAGVWGYSSFQGVGRLEEMLETDPDIVLISFGSNDAHPVGISDADYARRTLGSALETGGREWRISQLMRAVWDRLIVRGGQEGGHEVIGHRVTVPDFRANLVRMIEVCLANGATPVLLTRPYKGLSDDPLWWKSHAPKYRAVTTEIAREMGVLLIDVFSRFDRHESCFADESHFTPRGHQVAAKFIFERLRPLIDETGSPDGGVGPAPEASIDLPLELTNGCRDRVPWIKVSWTGLGGEYSYVVYVEHLPSGSRWEHRHEGKDFVEFEAWIGTHRVRLGVSTNCETPRFSAWQRLSVSACDGG